jgi:ubiquinone biosynthesis protein Coq4
MRYLPKETFITRPSGGWRASGMRWLVHWTQPLYRYLSRQNTPAWYLTTADLAHYPENSLGKTLANFLQTHNFTLMPLLENHDVFHVLLGYSATVLDEARMQYCLVGSGRYSPYALGTCAIAAICYPERLRDFLCHYRRGKTLCKFSYWNFRCLLAEDIADLRQAIARNLHTLHQ